LLERLDPEMFVQVHRSVVVRCDFIERLIHRGQRWSARLSDGTHQHIAKSHVGRVIEALRIGTTKAEAGLIEEIEPKEKIRAIAD
jgi:DNA-binding LytR/AlgR family response regulator